VREATGLSCSIGVTPNKLLSKISSDLDKPDGLTVLMHDDVPARIWPLPVSRINGIGPKATERLAAMGIRTIGELAATPAHELASAFGSHYGSWLHEAAHGRDDRPVVTWREPKSISRETTFERDLHPRDDRAQLTPILTRLCEQLASDLVRKNYAGRTVGVKLRYDDFKIVTRSQTLPAAHPRCGHHPPVGRPLPQDRTAEPAPAPAGRENGVPGAGRRPAPCRRALSALQPAPV
jgi:DNA polymerase-4